MNTILDKNFELEKIKLKMELTNKIAELRPEQARLSTLVGDRYANLRGSTYVRDYLNVASQITKFESLLKELDEIN